MRKNLLYLIMVISYYSYSQSTTITSGIQGTVQLPNLSYEQINAIPNPKAGMMVFDSTLKCLKYFNGIQWLCSSQNNDKENAVGFAWKHNFSGYYGQDNSSKIYIDINNNIYISGYLGFGYMTPFVAKYSETGNLIWKYESDAVVFSSAPALFNDIHNNTFALFNTNWKGNGSFTFYKFAPNGSLEWGRRLSANQGSNSANVSAEKMFLDNNQNIYITGKYYGVIATDAGTISSTSFTSFVAKYNNSGLIQWIRSIPYSIGVVGVNAIGECYFSGNFENSITIDGNPYYSYGGYDMIFGKLNGIGQLVWVKHIGDSGNDKITDCSIDLSGNFFAIGSFSNSLSFDGNTVNSEGAQDFFAVKYNSDGVFNWVRNGGGTGFDEGRKSQITYDNYLVVLGFSSSNSLHFYPDVTFNQKPSSSNFLIKYNTANGDIVWVTSDESSYDFKVNSNGDIYTWTSSGNVGNGQNDASNTFTKYLGNGKFAYKKNSQGTVTDLGFGKNNHFFFTGNFVGTIQIGASVLTCSDERGDIYISHWIE